MPPAPSFLAVCSGGRCPVVFPMQRPGLRACSSDATLCTLFIHAGATGSRVPRMSLRDRTHAACSTDNAFGSDRYRIGFHPAGNTSARIALSPWAHVIARAKGKAHSRQQSWPRKPAYRTQCRRPSPRHRRFTRHTDSNGLGQGRLPADRVRQVGHRERRCHAQAAERQWLADQDHPRFTGADQAGAWSRL